jgi:iron complex outermembrane receptor protein
MTAQPKLHRKPRLRRAESSIAKNTVRWGVHCALLTSAAALGTLPALAQDADEVIVTGSRIPRANLTAPTQVTTIDTAIIEQSGLINVADILRAVPSFGVSALSTGNSNFLTSGAGINTLALRNLEESRTLVLVNGRRYVSGLAANSAVDFNTIPIELVDRVEIITGGASAIYGSDALAGVINVILKDDFEGVQVGFQTGQSDAGGNAERKLTFSAGGNFADGRGNGVLSAAYTDQKGLFARERPNTQVDDIAECVLTDELGTCQTEVAPFFSSFSERGRFFVPSTGESFTISQGTGATGTVVPWDLEAYGFNRQNFRRYTVPTKRILLSGLVDYDVTDEVSAFLEATFAQTRTESELEPFPHSNSDLNIGGIPVDNPFVPQAIRDAVLAEGDDVVEYFRRTTEIGQRGDQAKRDTYRLVVGFEGDIADRWNWSTYYTFGRMDDAQQGGGQINVLNMREALNVIDGDGNPATFDPVCASEAAQAEGCVPINLFGLGSISPDAAEYVRAPQSRQQLTEQQVFGADIGASLLDDRNAGPIEFAFGVERRIEKSEDVPDVLTQRGLNAGNAEAPIRGQYDVNEAFVEVEVPLLQDKRLVQDLSIGAAYRHSDYSTVGNTDANAFRISWSPLESLRFRAQVAKAVRAPNIEELFAPGGEDFEPVSDPCNGVTAATPGQVAANCRSIPVIAQRIAASGVFNLTQTEIQGTAGFQEKGNLLLGPETSDSTSFGAVIDRDIGDSGTLNLSIDYFTIEIEQLIDIVDRQTALDFCYDVPSTSFPNNFCTLLVRDESGPAFQLGELEEVNSSFINEGTLETDGVDVSVLYSWNMAEWIGSWPGSASVRLNYTHLIDYTETKFGAPDDLVGETGYADDKWQAAFSFTQGRWNAQWEWTHIADSVPDNSSELFSFSVGDYNVHDLQVSYTIRGGEQGQTRAYLGINNVLDEDAPVILSGVPGNTTGTDTDADIYDPIGRTWYAGVTVSF